MLRRYHSHPVFAPRPSQKDCENQRNYQVLFRCGETGLEPFLGVIIGPYHLQLPTPVRCLSCRHLFILCPAAIPFLLGDRSSLLQDRRYPDEGGRQMHIHVKASRGAAVLSRQRLLKNVHGLRRRHR